MELTIEFSDGTEQTATSTEDAAEIILEAFANGVTVESIQDQDGKEYGATWSVTVAEL